MQKKQISRIIIFLVIAAVIGGVFFVCYNRMGGLKKPLSGEKKTERANINPALLDWEEVLLEAPWGGRDSHGALVYKNKIWVMGGIDGTTRLVAPGRVDYGNAPHLDDVWASEDGVEWKKVLNNAPWGKRRSMQVVEFKGKIWLMGGWGPELGAKNDVWASEDGVEWKLKTSSAAWPAREGHVVLLFQDKLWLIGGVNYSKQKTFNDVWSSEDGVNWVNVTEDAGWEPRWDFAAAVFKNRLWVISGMNLSQNMFNDVWSSGDGSEWDLEVVAAPFSKRQSAIIEYGGNLWVVGRLDDITNKGVNDVWYSEDGIIWEKTKTDPAWTGREDFGLIIFKSKMWILGGMDNKWEWKNDIWRSVGE